MGLGFDPRSAVFAALVLIGMAAVTPPAPAQAPAPDAAVEIAYLGLATKRSYPETWLDQPPADEGIQGARLAIADDNTTGRFTGQSFKLDEEIAADPAAVIAAFKKVVAAGARNIVTDLPAALLLQVADLPEAKDVTFIDATDADDVLRAEGCRRNVLHVLPSRAMLADALMQYLVVKNWKRIMLVSGKEPDDKLYADAIRASAKKFQVRIVADKPWTFNPAAQQADTGHFEVNTEVANLTQGLSFDLLVVADEADNFGDELSYRTDQPRPIAGTQGLVPTAWARPYDEMASTQLQARFLKQAHRWMTPRDYGGWLAVRAFGEAATRANSTDPAKVAAFLHGKDFELAGYKGPPLTFRPWDGQLRQPVLLADDRSLVSISPQPGFLHQFFETDTLGVDQPETKCHLH
ncbi:MAG: ABC transporter substrate-binding protein [Alphaproteobacteria bacterium]|nr:ABC transporter substrate-binding protein [Alphaproteobacteria bacterium]